MQFPVRAPILNIIMYYGNFLRIYMHICARNNSNIHTSPYNPLGYKLHKKTLFLSVNLALCTHIEMVTINKTFMLSIYVYIMNRMYTKLVWYITRDLRVFFYA